MTDLPVKRHRGHLLDARLHLLDRQLFGDEGDPVGIVDDLELSDVEVDKDIPEGAEAPQVISLFSGQVLVARMLGGEPPLSRLQSIPWTLVASVGVVVKLKSSDMSIDVGWMERWLRDRIIRHIPGGRHAVE